jgi:hypothetical protein
VTTLTGCPDPECSAPAEEVDRYVLDSTAGPVVHVATQCLKRHNYVHIEENP